MHLNTTTIQTTNLPTINTNTVTHLKVPIVVTHQKPTQIILIIVAK